MLLDEPTEGIQPNIVEQIEHAIVRLNVEHGITMILVSRNHFAPVPRNVSVMMEKVRSQPKERSTNYDQLVHRHMAV